MKDKTKEVAEIKYKRIRIPIYFGELELCQTDDFDSVGNHYNIDIAKCGGVALRDMSKPGKIRYIIVVRKSVSPAIIAHESLHVVGYIYEDLRIEFSVENDEPQCYLLEWIVEQCHKYFKINNKNIQQKQ